MAFHRWESEGMGSKRFDEQMHAYDRWRSDLLRSVENYKQWLDDSGLGNPDDDLRIYELLESLRTDRLTIAFAAEFARGKTELINAIFFSEYDRRLLPSEAGRTTMCPTELFYDQKAARSYIRLLPIETRLTDTRIAEYKENPVEWTTMELELDDPESMAEAFREIVRVKKVDVQEAQRLGLYDEGLAGTAGQVEIPMWRHALISFPHPMLKQGLVILDTPGLNALGSEPELTLNMLPSAQAVIFVLAADTGVTKSDLDMWRHHVKPLRSIKEKGVIVVLNKVDTLWDELKGEPAVRKMVQEQCRKAAETLALGQEMVFPASAQKGLLAKIRHDPELLERSNIPALEAILASDILPRKQDLLREHIIAEIGGMIRDSRDLIATRFTSVQNQLTELRSISGKNNDIIEHLMKKTREEQVSYYKDVESYQANKRLLAEQAQRLRSALSLTELDRLVADTRREMTESWTTHGLKIGMKTFFDGVSAKMNEVASITDQVNRLVTTVYRKFHQDHGLSEMKPVLFSVTKYAVQLKQLHEEAEAFRNSPVTTMTEQSFVVKKFFISLVSHARNIFFKARQDAEKWSRAVMTPLASQIKEHKAQMEKRLENLRKVNESRDTLQGKLEELQQASVVLERQLNEVEGLLEAIHRPVDGPEAAMAKAG